jgi:DNA polymerase
MNRIDMLKEMGITPVWVPRRAQGAEGAIPEIPVTIVPAAEAAPPQLPEVPPRKSLGGKGFEGIAPARRSQSSSPAGAPADSAGDPERAARIARMDWPQLQEAVAGCQACALCKGRTNTVFGVGDQQADWMIIGEAPGQEEDRLGEPFVGQAGKLLDSMLAALDMQRSTNVFIANVLKCRPPANRNPDPDEVAQCSPHLMRQVELVAPKVILLMGRFAVQSILQTDASIASLRGRLHQYRGIPAVVTYHPAYLLRNLPDKSKAWEDLLFARSVLAS